MFRPKRPEAFDPNVHLEVTPAFLREAIEMALAAGLTPVRLADLPRLLADPGDRRRFVCFTLDDGYRNNAAYAAPVFRAYNIPYTIFITPGFVERTSSLWWETAAALLRQEERITFDFGSGEKPVPTATTLEKLRVFNGFCHLCCYGDQDATTARINRAAAAAGVNALDIVDRELMTAAELRALAEDPLADFGGHTMTHPVLARVSAERLATEISQSVAATAAYTGRQVTTFAYPYGTSCSVGEREFAAARAAGLELAVTTRPGMLSDNLPAQPTAVKRISLNGLYQKPHYVRALISGIPARLKG